MHARRLLLHRLAVDGEPQPLRRGDVVVVARDGAAHSDWEVVADLRQRAWLPAGGHHVDMDGLVAGGDGAPRRCQGRAFVVRQVGSTVVLRGDGPLRETDATSED